MINICFDLDGPIIDVSDRYYRAYLESLKGFDIDKSYILTKDKFWQLRQNRVPDSEIGLLSGLTIKEAKESAELRKGLTFKTEHLVLDKLFNDVYETLDYLKSKSITFFIATLRRRSQLDIAIKQFKLSRYFPERNLFSLSNEQKVQEDIQEKYTLFFNAINTLGLNPLESYVIGDSDTDIHAGRLAKYKKVVAITRGIRSKEQLEILKPDHIVSNLKEFLSFLTANL